MKKVSEFYQNIAPIAAPINPDKQGAKRHWGSHPYFTRRAWNVVQRYVQTFCEEGDTVLDPFGGSGVTAIESLVLHRKAVHCDINPMANFICQQIAVAPVNLTEFVRAYDSIEKHCRKHIEQVYGKKDKEVEDQKIPHWYPKGIRLPKNADVEFIEQLFTRRQLFSLSLLLHHIDSIKPAPIRDLMRFVFSATLNKTNLTFSSTHGRLASRGNSGIMHRYRYWVPPDTLDLNVWEQFEQKFKNTYKVKQETNRVIGSFYRGNLAVHNLSATDLTKKFAKESFDYIYTDPPYGAHIAYLDLSTMWNAWLGFTVSAQDRKNEVIEGGDLNKSKHDYTELLEESIEQMFQVLKFDRWLSIVFAHKDPAYWDAIINAAQRAGFEYSNTAVQPSTTPSLHKRQNPLKVLSGELVLNFRKVRSPKAIAITKIGVGVVQLIKEVAESTIVINSGATTEEVYNSLIPKLLEHGLLGEMKKDLDDITPLLRAEFEFSDDTGKWGIKPNTKIGSFIPLKDRIRFYLIDYLQKAEREGHRATFDDIIQHVMPNLINGTTPKTQTILSVLERIAQSTDNQHWQLGRPTTPQMELSLGDSVIAPSVLPEISFHKDPDKIEHNAIIYTLTNLGMVAGFKVHVGKKEQLSEGWAGTDFNELSLNKLPITKEISEWEKKKIEQIDVIWFDENEPVMAFEVETSTPITTGFDRFMELLKHFPHLARRVVLIIPPKRLKKMTQLLFESHYIGHPLYMENKLVFSFTNKIALSYQSLAAKPIKITKPRLLQSIIDTFVVPQK